MSDSLSAGHTSNASAANREWSRTAGSHGNVSSSSGERPHTSDSEEHALEAKGDDTVEMVEIPDAIAPKAGSPSPKLQGTTGSY